MKNYIIPFAIFLISLCTFNQSLAQDYILGEGDLLKITVYDHPDLTTTERISGEGNILFPLIGKVKVSGSTATDVSKKIAELLSEGYIVSPQVTVFIDEFRSQKATIMGQVNRPGLYELKGATTFLEVLSKAGDLTKDAGDKATIKRRPDASGKEKIVTVDLKLLIEKGDTSYDVPIVDGDSIYVIKAGVFHVTGEIKKPDSYKFVEGITVIKAITEAGGFTEKASTGRVKILRKLGGTEIIMDKVRMDEPVMQDDLIVVPESFF